MYDGIGGVGGLGGLDARRVSGHSCAHMGPGFTFQLIERDEHLKSCLLWQGRSRLDVGWSHLHTCMLAQMQRESRLPGCYCQALTPHVTSSLACVMFGVWYLRET